MTEIEPIEESINSRETPQNEEKPRWYDVFWETFVSLKMTIFVLIALGLLSIVGTFVLQNKSIEELSQIYPEWLMSIFGAVGFFDIYSSTMFLFFTLLLMLNLIACSLDRWPKVAAGLAPADPKLPIDQLRKFRFKSETPLKGAKQYAAKIDGKLSEIFGKHQKLEDGGDTVLFLETNRYRRLGFYGVHLSLLIILFGAIFGALFGENGYLPLGEGEEKGYFHNMVNGRLLGQTPLNFTVRLNSFSLERYETGQPKDYKSDLSILVGGKEVMRKTIEVNDPMEYDGYDFYQSSYEQLSPGGVFELEIKNKESGESHAVTASFGEVVQPPGLKGSLVVEDFKPNFSGMGKAVRLRHSRTGEKDSNFWIFKNFPNFDATNRQGSHTVILKEAKIKERFRTGLQVARDPSVTLVFLGCIILMLSMIYTLTISHRRLWVRIGDESVMMAGLTDRQPEAFKNKFRQLKDYIENPTDGEKRSD